MPTPRATLEQWLVLQAVAEHGSFARAAEALSRSQSSVSYTLAQLQSQLPVAVLAQQGRRAVLTEAGEVLLRRSHALVEEARSLERLAARLAEGWESEVTLAVEVIFPTDLLLTALASFNDACDRQGHEVRLQLIESVLSGTDEALFSGEVDLVISPRVPPGFLGRPLLRVDFIAVAAPHHTLHQVDRDLTTEDLKSQRQLVVRDSGVHRSQDQGWLGAEQRWTVSHLKTSIDAVRRGLGFAWLPVGQIQAELDQGLLKPLPLTEGGRREVMLYLITARGDDAGPGVRQLAETLMQCCSDHP